MDKRQIIAALVEKTGIKLDEHDPAFLLVDLNLMMLENQTSQAAQQLTHATREFSEVTTRNVDDFVTVANEALSKFIQRTNELKTALDRMPPAVAAPATVPASTNRKKPPRALLWWLVPLIFAAGLVAGLALSFLIGK